MSIKNINNQEIMKGSKKKTNDYEDRMTMNSLFVAFVLACLLTGCAPRVVSDMYTYEFAPLPPDSVQVFQADEPVPSGSIAIGTVKVVDNGLSVGGGYERVLRMAIGETARNGGNGLVVTEHRVPDMRSTIHRVWGTMLRMDRAAADTAVRASVERALAGSVNDSNKQYGNVSLRKEKNPENVFRVSIGPSWLLSRYVTGFHEYKSKCGFEVTADYEHLWKWGIGIGVNYLHSYTMFDEDLALRLNYVGPSLAMGYMLGAKWRIGAGIGVGYGWRRETAAWESYTEGNVAVLLRMSLEYMPVRDFGLGLQMNTMTLRLDKPDNFRLKENEFYGIRSLGIMAALHFYL